MVFFLGSLIEGRRRPALRVGVVGTDQLFEAVHHFAERNGVLFT